MKTPSHSFQLDSSIFNEKLYSELRNTWFAGLDSNASVPDYSLMQRWYGAGLSQEQKSDFDEECRSKFGSALQSIGPEKLALPPFESYDADIKRSEHIARPFLNEFKVAQQEGQQQCASRLLALCLLLDQMPRNIYRTPDGLRLVYSHFDRLGFALAHTCMRISPNPMYHSSLVSKIAYMNWIWLPLVHSEHLPSHDEADKMLQEAQKRTQTDGDEQATSFVEQAWTAMREHREPLEEFGRYPHRNACLGRQSTNAEKKYLEVVTELYLFETRSQSDRGGKSSKIFHENGMPMSQSSDGDLPSINPAFEMKPHRYVRSVIDRGRSSFIYGLAKTDIVTGTSVIWDWLRHTPGEPMFVPRPDAEDEDDGFVLTVDLDGDTGSSYLLCFGASTITEIERAEVGRAVGLGFSWHPCGVLA